MNSSMSTNPTPFPLRKILPLLVVILTLLLSVSSAIEWYADRVSLPRYCADPNEALHYLAANLREDRPAGDSSRRPYLIAAKLLFLVPRGSAESIPDYLDRVELEILRHCQ